MLTAIFLTDNLYSIERNDDSSCLTATTYFSQGAGGQAFTLNAGFPPKDVTDPDATLADAGLVGSSVTMKSA
jgi:hypothetical protein